MAEAENGGAGVVVNAKVSNSLMTGVSKLELAKENDPQSALASFPGSLHTLNVVQVIVGTSEEVSIDIKKFLGHAQEMQKEAMDNFREMESRKSQIEIDIKTHKEGSEVHIKLTKDLDVVQEQIIAERKEASKNTVNPAVIQKLRTSLSGNCTLVVHEVRDTLLLAHENCNHMTKAAERIIAHVACLKKDMHKGPRAVELYMKTISREAENMHTWASEVGESALFTNKVVDAVQLLLVDQIKENNLQMQEAEERNKIAKEEKRRKERQILAAVEKRQRDRKDAEKFRQKMVRSQERFDQALSDQNTAKYARSWRRVLSLGIGHNPTSIEQAKVDQAQEQIRHFLDLEKKAREQAWEQEKNEQRLMDVVIKAATDISLNENKAEYMKRMIPILEQVQIEMAKFQQSWMQLRLFASKLCVETRHQNQGAKKCIGIR